MNKKRLTIGIIAIAVVALIITLVFVFNSNKKDNIDNPSSSSDSSEVNEPLDVVEDVKDKITSDNLKSVLDNCTELNKHFNIKVGKSNNMMRLGDSLFRVVDYDNYYGYGKVSSDDTFNASVTQGINTTPDIGISFMTSSLSDEDIENIAYDVIRQMTSEEVADKIKEISYNTSDVFEIKTDSEEYSDITVQKFKTSSEDSENNKIYNSYSYGVHYNAYKENESNKYTFTEYDKKLFLNLPIFNKSGILDIETSLSTLDLTLLFGAESSVIDGYSSYNLGSIYKNTLSITSKTKSGETLQTSFNFTYDEDTELMNYTFNTMTYYTQNADEALVKALEVINGITELEISKEELVGDESINSYIYSDESGNNIITIDIKEEQGLGYYALINAM